MRIRANALGLVVIIVIFGGIAVSSLVGFWNTTNTKVPAQITSGEYAGSNDPADIRGSYSFADIRKNFDIPIEVLAKVFGVDEKNAEGFKCKDLEALYTNLKESGTEIGTDSVRYFVALYKQLPYTPSENTFLPSTAVKILKDKGVLNAEQEKYLESHNVVIK